MLRCTWVAVALMVGGCSLFVGDDQSDAGVGDEADAAPAPECTQNSECPVAAPICENELCRGCRASTECDSGACDLSLGSCVLPSDIWYLDSAAGVDDSACGSREAPCKTWDFVEPRVRTETDRRTVHLAPGTYGKTGSVLEIQASTTGPGLFRMVGEQGAVIQADPAFAGIQVDDAVAVLEGITVTGTSNDRNLVECRANGTLTLFRVSLVDSNGLGAQSVNCSQLTINASVIRNNAGGGIDVQNTAFVITNNFIFSNGDGDSPHGGANLINDGTVGIERFEHNTVAMNTRSLPNGFGVVCRSEEPMPMANNIVVDPTKSGDAVIASDGCNFAYSIIQTTDNGKFPGTENVATQPMFVDAPVDFHLRADTPAGLDDADPASTVAFDIDIEPRPFGDGPDRGADELH